MNGHQQGQHLADFDPEAHPIIARHWLGLPRKWACGRRPLGPGEVARARELRKRGIHLRLVAAVINSPQNTRNQNMTEQELESLKTVIRYLWRDEQKNFEECELNDGKAPDDHIFRHVDSLNGYLLREHNADAWASA